MIPFFSRFLLLIRVVFDFVNLAMDTVAFCIQLPIHDNAPELVGYGIYLKGGANKMREKVGSYPGFLSILIHYLSKWGRQ